MIVKIDLLIKRHVKDQFHIQSKNNWLNSILVDCFIVRNKSWVVPKKNNQLFFTFNRLFIPEKQFLMHQWLAIQTGTKIAKVHKIFILVHSFSTATSSSFESWKCSTKITSLKPNTSQWLNLEPYKIDLYPCAEPYHRI